MRSHLHEPTEPYGVERCDLCHERGAREAIRAARELVESLKEPQTAAGGRAMQRNVLLILSGKPVKPAFYRYKVTRR